MYYGNKKIIDVNYGGTPIKKAYYGSQLVWQKSPKTYNYGWWYGYPYVDLGLPSGKLWALYNYDVNLTLHRYEHVNAEPDLGNLPKQDKINNVYTHYYQWGRIQFTNNPTTDNCPTWQQQVDDFSNDIRFDVIASKWRNGWRMPTYNDYLELINNTTAYVIYETVFDPNYLPSDVPLYYIVRAVFESKTNGTRLILPACGYSSEPINIDDNYELIQSSQPSDGYYWTSTPANDSSNENAFRFHFNGDSALDGISHLNLGTGSRALGRSIRAVLDRSSLDL